VGKRGGKYGGARRDRTTNDYHSAETRKKQQKMKKSENIKRKPPQTLKGGRPNRPLSFGSGPITKKDPSAKRKKKKPKGRPHRNHSFPSLSKEEGKRKGGGPLYFRDQEKKKNPN